ncbi:9433_t:CDS:2 [Acaulospora colombiana]|uniref:9433_t:CDS:1 n=1 Tax=Acaulospora colombiana TaxID=27376 RepID=A0ACA9MNP6_9GLOM|nr:9433_t:CDS:2 [Acaulospora colombiana]
MDERLFGGPVQGDRVFEQCVKCLEAILSEVTSCFPGTSTKCAFEASADDPVMRVYVEPEEWDEETQGERPLVELYVSATSYLNGKRITGPMNFGTQDDQCTSFVSIHPTVMTLFPGGILLNIARSSSSSSELRASIRKERDALVERKDDFHFSLPRGMDAKTMAQKWVGIDYTRKPSVDADSNEGIGSSQVAPSTSDEQLERLALRFNSKRPPSKFVTNLRALAKQGREYLDSLEQGVAEESNDPSLGPHLVRTGTPESVLASPDIEGVEQSNDSMALASTFEDISSEKGEESGHSSTLEAEHVKLSEEVESQAADMGVLRERSSVQVKMAEEYSSPKGAAEGSADVDHGKISVTSDNYSPPTEKDPLGDVQSTDTLDIVGSEDDILGPTNYDDSHLSLASSDQATECQEELRDEDQAWPSHSKDQNEDISENQNMVTKENAKDTL